VSSDSEEIKTLSFDEIVEYIKMGKEVPGIRDIPDLVSTETPSASTIPVPPKKPWEKEVSV